MLFNEVLKQKYQKLEPLFNELFALAIKNQAHSGDMLLVMENALIRDEIDTEDPSKYQGYYNLGPGMDYHCETANHEFIKDYIKSTIDLPYHDYLKMHEYSQERSKEIDEMQKQESLTIQVEMLIYLKIWEGEAFLKKMYQISRLINGDAYDWHLRLTFERNKKKKDSGSLERGEILKLLKENLEKKLPELNKIIKYNHRPQLRNAIAHSQYAMLGRDIYLDNHKEDKENSFPSLTFDEWIDIFHETITIFTLYEMLLYKVKEYYYERSKPFKLKQEVNVTRRYPVNNNRLLVLYSREIYKDWSPYPGHN